MTEEAAMYQVNGENHAVPITDINTLWIAGWMWENIKTQTTHYRRIKPPQPTGWQVSSGGLQRLASTTAFGNG